jgi:acyl-homoserine-lactone acylase
MTNRRKAEFLKSSDGINYLIYNALRYLPVLFLLYFAAGYKVQAQNPKTEILWDNYGVPHIFGKNTRETYYSFGWAQMNNHANLILQLYGQARGRAAEYWGKKYLESDKKILLFELPQQAKDVYLQQGKEYKSYLDAFVKGINDYANKNPDAIGENFKQVLPVTVYDVLSHVIRVMCLEFLASEDIYNAKRITDSGSNACAIAPSKSASKNAMLISNPHLPWEDFLLWFEAHLNTSDFNAYGVTLVGMPVLTIAFNNNLGWTHTVNTIDASDMYELDIQENGYRLDEKIVPFDKKIAVIKVKQDDGTLQEQGVEFKYSKHGPVVGEKGNKAYAVRIAGLKNPKIFEQYHKMTKAKDLNEFESALKMLQNPMFNVIYADKSGNILYLFNGNVPKRTEGDFAYWRGTIDGTKSKFIWQQFHTYEDLPRVLNPPAGFLQNCNDPPWTCTYPAVLDPGKFPSYIAPQVMSLRAQRAVNMIKDNPSISFDQLISYKLNTGMEAADRFLNDLLDAVERFPDSTAVKAATILKAWDRNTDVSSRGAVLFAEWWDQLRRNMFEVPWSPDNPVTTPMGLKDQKQAVDLLMIATDNVIKRYGSPDVAWGEVYRFRMNGLDYPANGGPGQYGIFRTMSFIDDNDNKKHAVAGDTYVAVTEFGEKVRAQVLLSYGNATQPGNKHIGDQLKMLSDKKLRPALLEKPDILKNLEKRESPGSDYMP